MSYLYGKSSFSRVTQSVERAICDRATRVRLPLSDLVRGEVVGQHRDWDSERSNLSTPVAIYPTILQLHTLPLLSQSTSRWSFSPKKQVPHTSKDSLNTRQMYVPRWLKTEIVPTMSNTVNLKMCNVWENKDFNAWQCAMPASSSICSYWWQRKISQNSFSMPNSRKLKWSKQTKDQTLKTSKMWKWHHFAKRHFIKWDL